MVAESEVRTKFERKTRGKGIRYIEEVKKKFESQPQMQTKRGASPKKKIRTIFAELFYKRAAGFLIASREGEQSTVYIGKSTEIYFTRGPLSLSFSLSTTSPSKTVSSITLPLFVSLALSRYINLFRLAHVAATKIRRIAPAVASARFPQETTAF